MPGSKFSSGVAFLTMLKFAYFWHLVVYLGSHRGPLSGRTSPKMIFGMSFDSLMTIARKRNGSKKSQSLGSDIKRHITLRSILTAGRGSADISWHFISNGGSLWLQKCIDFKYAVQLSVISSKITFFIFYANMACKKVIFTFFARRQKSNFRLFCTARSLRTHAESRSTLPSHFIRKSMYSSSPCKLFARDSARAGPRPCKFCVRRLRAVQTSLKLLFAGVQQK